jgi:group II intron reverse transcriptase/maturase
MQTSLQGIANRARTHPAHRFGNLYGLLNEKNLIECFYQLRKNGATGVDKVDFKTYEANLEENVAALVDRLKRKVYKARLVKRVYIPKGNGKKRPLGILVLEDKLLQLCASKILNAIYEEDFLKTSFGFRPGKSAKDAMVNLSMDLQYGRFGWIIDADIEAYFDNINHEWLIKMLEKRIHDGAFTRLIRKWLKAGILETDGKVIHPATGTPQGGIISPILSNVYLHYVLDLWFEKRIKPECKGKAKYIRYADDSVWAFQYRSEAVKCLKELKLRLEKFGLRLSDSKTRLIPFNRFWEDKNDRFDFLGFEFYWDVNFKGKPQVKKRTSRKKLQGSIQTFTAWIKENRHKRISKIMKTIRRKLLGYWNYYGIPGNSDSLWLFYKEVWFRTHKWLNRRSDRKSYNWQGMVDLFTDFTIPQPVIKPINMDGKFEFC